jgi:hypothetical protein
MYNALSAKYLMTKMTNLQEFAKPSTDWSVNDLPEAAQIELRKEIEQATTVLERVCAQWGTP